MVESFRIISKGWDTVNEGGQYLGLFLSAMVFLFIVESRRNKTLFLYCLLALVLLWNPLTGGMLIRCFGFEECYWQAFWLLPQFLACACCAVQAVKLQKDKKDKVILFCSLVLVAAVGGRLMNDNGQLARRENGAYIAAQYQQFFESISAEGDKAVLLANEEIMENARACGAELFLPYEPALMKQEDAVWSRFYDPELRLLYQQMEKPANCLGSITPLARKYRCNYLILPLKADDRAAMEYGGYRVVNENEKYVLYYDTLCQ